MTEPLPPKTGGDSLRSAPLPSGAHKAPCQLDGRETTAAQTGEGYGVWIWLLAMALMVIRDGTRACPWP